MLLHKPMMAALGVLGYAGDQIAALPVFQRPTPIGWTRDEVRSVVLQEAGHFLEDFEWRYKQARDLYEEMQLLEAVKELPEGAVTVDQGGNIIPFRSRKLTAEDINDTTHRLTGYTVTPNSSTSPTVTAAAGNFAWAGLHIVYRGVDYTIADGAGGLTNKYFTFVYTTVTTTGSTGTASLAASTTKPTLAADDILVFINPPTNAAAGTSAGTPIVAASDANGSLPRIVGNATVDTAALQASAVTSNELGTNAVIAGKIANGAVNSNLLFTTGVVDSGALGPGAATASKLNILSHILL